MATSAHNIKSFFKDFQDFTKELAKDAKDLKTMVDRPVFSVNLQDQNSSASSVFYTSSFLESLNEKVEYLERETRNLKSLPGKL
jgi:hypothetical protein